MVGAVWRPQPHGGEFSTCMADLRRRAVAPIGPVRGPLCALRHRRARSDGRIGARWPRFAIVAVLRAPVRTDVSIFRAPEIRAGSAAHEHLRMVCTMPASDSGRLAGTATRGVLCHHPGAGSRVRTACGTCHLSPPPRLVCDHPHGCFASAPQTPWQHTCTCCLVPPCAAVYRAWYRALCRLEPPFEPPFVPGFVPQCRGLLSVASDLASPSTAWERGLQRKRAAASWHWPRISIGLLCAPKGIAESFIFRMVSARQRVARTRL
jgi:hypothetical protein